MESTRMMVVSAVVTMVVCAGCGGEGATSAVEGRWEGPGRSTIDLRPGGTGAGNDGCNDVAVDWEPRTDTTGSFQISESSEIGCPDVVGWDEAAAYLLRDDTLVIESGDGKELAELTRVG